MSSMWCAHDAAAHPIITMVTDIGAFGVAEPVHGIVGVGGRMRLGLAADPINDAFFCDGGVAAASWRDHPGTPLYADLSIAYRTYFDIEDDRAFFVTFAVRGSGVFVTREGDGRDVVFVGPVGELGWRFVSHVEAYVAAQPSMSFESYADKTHLGVGVPVMIGLDLTAF
jgi:hypothetical protein